MRRLLRAIVSCMKKPSKTKKLTIDTFDPKYNTTIPKIGFTPVTVDEELVENIASAKPDVFEYELEKVKYSTLQQEWFNKDFYNKLVYLAMLHWSMALGEVARLHKEQAESDIKLVDIKAHIDKFQIALLEYDLQRIDKHKELSNHIQDILYKFPAY